MRSMRKSRAGKGNRTGRKRVAAGPGFRIRRAKASDLRAVVAMSSGVREIENYPGQKMKEADFAHFVKGYGSTMLVAVADTVPVGYVTIYESDNYFYLPYAVTLKKWRSRGVGSALLEEVERLARERRVEYILMSVYAYNASVHRFLKNRGYAASRKLVQYSKIITTKGRR